jgi:hypothetical protein
MVYRDDVTQAAMVLADLGADVVRVQRAGKSGSRGNQQLRGRRIVQRVTDPSIVTWSPSVDGCV